MQGSAGPDFPACPSAQGWTVVTEGAQGPPQGEVTFTSLSLAAAAASTVGEDGAVKGVREN